MELTYAVPGLFNFTSITSINPYAIWSVGKTEETPQLFVERKSLASIEFHLREFQHSVTH